MALVSTIPAVAVRTPAGLMVMEQLAQLESTENEPKSITLLVATMAVEVVAAKPATGHHATEQIKRPAAILFLNWRKESVFFIGNEGCTLLAQAGPCSHLVVVGQNA